jgi:type I restriction enzyme M protein
MYNLKGLTFFVTITKQMAKTGKSIRDGKKTLPLLDASVEPPGNSVCAEFLVKLKSEYRYTDEQIAVIQKSDDFEIGLGWARADIVVWKSVEDRENKVSPFIVVQSKSHAGLRLEDFFEGIEFARKNTARLFVTIDKQHTSFYKLQEGKFISIETPNPKELKDGKKIEDALSHDEDFKREQFKKRLFACHNVIRNNDKFSPEMAFDEISKVMFVKIYREQMDKNRFTLEQYRRLKDNYTEATGGKPETPYFQSLFNQTKNSDRFKKDEIFEVNDKLRIREESFSSIIKELEDYYLAEIFDDVKGLAFEEFLGTTFRGELGQFFTPRTVVDFMADIIDPQESEMIADPCCGSGGFLIKSFDLVKDAITNDIKNVKIRFREQIINEDFQKLSEKEQAETLRNLDKVFSEINKELSPKYNGKEDLLIFDAADPQSRLFKLSTHCIFGTDAEPRSARTAKMNMIMRGDGHSGVHHHDGLIHVNGMLENHFDIILTNPPFGSRISRDLVLSENDLDANFTKLDKLKNRYDERFLAKTEYVEKYTKEQNDLKEKLEEARRKAEEEETQKKSSSNKESEKGYSVLELFDTGKKDGEIKSTLTEVVFMERCLDLLKKGGRMGVVLPEGFLNTMDLQNAREYFEGRAKLVLIASIPQDVFIAAGATVKPSLIFLKKFTEAEEIEYNRIKTEVTAEVDAKYQPQLDEIEAEFQALKAKVDSFDKSLKESKGDLKKKDADKDKLKKGIEFLTEQLKTAKENLRKGKKAYETKKAEIENRIKREIVQGIKDLFDYEIPIVQANDAGVTSTGSASGKSDFPVIEKEHKLYRRMRAEANDPLWLSETIEYEYSLENFVLHRRLKPQIEAVKQPKKKKFKFSGEAVEIE